MTILCNSQTHFLTPPPRETSADSMWSNSNSNSNKDDDKNNIQMTSQNDDDDDSWEIRAFEEDTTGNLLGCTWPPRSYTCTFCRREFRSAQALGGHMNVHRRDRARLHQAPPLAPPPTAAQPPLLIQANGLCLFYPLQNPNSTIIFPTPPMDFSSHLLPNISPPAKPTDTAPNSVVSSVCHSSNTEPSASNSYEHGRESAMEEELDLELRLGRRTPPPP